MNCDRGFLQRLTVSVYLLRIRGELAIGAPLFVPQTSHEGGCVKRALHCLIKSGSRRLIGLRASLLVFSKLRSTAHDVGPVELWATH
jgi:hypothetical protein